MKFLGLAPAFVLLLAGCAAPEAKKAILSQDAPAPIGPYSQGVESHGMVFVSAQLAIDPKTGKMADDIKGQTRQVLTNISSILAAAGLTLDDAVQSQVFLTDVNEFAAMNEVYATFFKGIPPARTTVQVSRLPRDAKITISMVAARK